MPPCAVPAPTLDAVKKFIGAVALDGVGEIGVTVPAVVVAAVPIHDWETWHATEQYTVAPSNCTGTPPAACCTVAAVAAADSATVPVVADHR